MSLDLKQVRPDSCHHHKVPCDLQNRPHLENICWTETGFYSLLLKSLQIACFLTQNVFVEIIRLVPFYEVLNKSSDQGWILILLVFIS